MQFFRSPLLRRIIYAIAIALALVRFATTRSHSQPFLVDDAAPQTVVQRGVP
jgi:hypothetical protein